MLTPEQFITLWSINNRHNLYRYDDETLGNIAIPPEAREFLVKAGLPQDAPPFLSFGGNSGTILKKVTGVFGGSTELSPCYIIGYDGSGDPICIDEDGKGRIVVFNHDDKFKKVFVNNTVTHLAEFLIVFRNLVNDAVKENGPDAYLDWNIPIQVLENSIGLMKQIDPLALDNDSFWAQQLLYNN